MTCCKPAQAALQRVGIEPATIQRGGLLQRQFHAVAQTLHGFAHGQAETGQVVAALALQPAQAQPVRQHGGAVEPFAMAAQLVGTALERSKRSLDGGGANLQTVLVLAQRVQPAARRVQGIFALLQLDFRRADARLGSFEPLQSGLDIAVHMQ